MSTPLTRAAFAAPRTAPAWAGIALWTAYVALDTGSQLAFKWAGDRIGPDALDLAWVARALVTPGLWIGVGCYVGTLFVWMRVLQRMDLSRAFPMSGLSYVTVPAMAVVLFGESLTSTQLAGIAAICAGVVLLAFDKE